jgi:hypothetical protein
MILSDMVFNSINCFIASIILDKSILNKAIKQVFKTIV